MKKRFFTSLIIIFSFVNFAFGVTIKPNLIIMDERDAQQESAPLLEDNAVVLSNEGVPIEQYIETDDQEIENPEEKYKDYAIKLDSTENNSLNNSGALFILGAEKVENINDVKAVNTFWDKSKNFSYTYYQDVKNISPMPSLFNTSYLVSKINSQTKAYVGQSTLSDFNDIPVFFVRANETNFDNGFKLVSNANNFNVSVGAFNSTLNNRLSGGAVISTKSINISNIAGNFVLGGGYYSNELDNDNKNTGGLFAEYRYKRLKLNVQGAKSKYANSPNLETGLYFTPEIKLTDSLSLRTRYIKNIAQNTDQGLIGLSYKPVKNNSRDFEFSINAANNYTLSVPTSQMFTFSTKFKI